MLAIGLMSGTSMDGIDAALIDTDGEGENRRIGFHFAPYDDAMRDRLRAACTLAAAVERPGPDEMIDGIARDLTLAHAEAVHALLEATGTDAAKVGSLSIRIGLGWAKSQSFTTGQCPVMKYNRQLMMAILHDRTSIAKNVHAQAISLEDAPRGYAEFDQGAATKYVLNPNGLIKAA